MENKNNTGAIISGASEAYDWKVAGEALARAGKNKNLHGIVHEVMYKNSQNINPTNIVNGTKAVLSKSSTALRDDVLLMNAGKVVGRAQLKDTAKSINHTLKQVASGKYQGTVMMGTKETVAAYNSGVAKAASNGVKITQTMKSTGVSSADTARIASKALGSGLTTKALTSAAKNSGVSGAVLSAGIETICAGKDLLDGNIEGSEFATRVAKETVGGGLSAAVGIGAAVAVGSAVKGIWDSIFD